jgi:hypothetical protein
MHDIRLNPTLLLTVLIITGIIGLIVAWVKW